MLVDERLYDGAGRVLQGGMPGSGVTAENVHQFQEADGFIVGSALKYHGRAAEPVDAERVRALTRVRESLT